MKFFKNIVDGYIFGISTKIGQTEISKEDYDAIKSIITNRPAPADGFDYKLRADTLEWELVELPPIEPEPLTDDEALTRYANSITGANDTTITEAAETLLTEMIKED